MLTVFFCYYFTEIYYKCKYAYKFQIFATIMKEKGLIHKIWAVLKKRYRFLVVNDETLEERGSIKLSSLNVFVFVLLFSFCFFILSFILIVYSPINEHLPGKSSTKVQKEIISLAIKSDSLETALKIRSLYLKNIEAIIRGDSLVFDYSYDSLNKINDEEIIFSVSKEDSLLREKVEEEEQGLLNIGAPEPTKYFLFYPPLKNGIISDSFSVKNDHYAVDIVAKKGAKIKSILEGTVVVSDWNPQTGYVIGIQHPNNFISFYKHCSRLLKKTGDAVSVGEYIAIIGNSGELSTGPHLHLELWRNGNPLNPENYIAF